MHEGASSVGGEDWEDGGTFSTCYAAARRTPNSDGCKPPDNRGQASQGNQSADPSGSRGRRCPFLALWAHQRAANGSKQRHKAKVENRRILRVMKRGSATSSAPPQR